MFCCTEKRLGLLLSVLLPRGRVNNFFFFYYRQSTSTWKKRLLTVPNHPITVWLCRLRPRNYCSTWANTAQDCESERTRRCNPSKSDLSPSKESSVTLTRRVHDQYSKYICLNKISSFEYPLWYIRLDTVVILTNR